MTPVNSPQVCRRQVLAFRLAGHHLDHRLEHSHLIVAAGACGLQNTPPGGALLALNARVEGITAGDLETGLEERKTLLQCWSLRCAPHVFPSADAAPFTLALIPASEEELRQIIYGVIPALETLHMSAMELVQVCRETVLTRLAGRSLTKDELGREMAEEALARLSPAQVAGWRLPSLYAAGQSLGESAARFALYVLGMEGLVCHAERQTGKAYLRLTHDWLRYDIRADAAESAAELARRYLRCYGPSTVDEFAAWAGISLAQANRLWSQVEDELAPVRFENREVFLLEQDPTKLKNSPDPVGARLLPPHDPYLNQRDREALLPVKTLHKRMWRTVGNPGAVLLDGEVVGLWRPQKTGARLALAVETWAEIPAPGKKIILEEAERMTFLRGMQSVEMRYSITNE